MTWNIISQLIRMANDIFLTIFFFHKIPNVQGRGFVLRQLLGFLCLMLTMPLYITENISTTYFVDNVWLRYGIRLLATLGYLCCTKMVLTKVSFYWALWFNTCLNECHNLFMTPFFKDIRLGYYHIVDNVILNSLISTMMECLIFAFVIVVARWNVRNFTIKRNLKERFILISLIMLLTLYIKSTLRFYTDTGLWIGGNVENVFPVIMVVLILIVIMLTERFWEYQEMKIRYEARLMTEDYHYQNMLDRAQAEEEVRRLYHDMKNHLNVLSTMSGDGNELRSYINDISNQLKGYERTMYTGNDTLDIILSMKLKQAQEQGIVVNAFVDFTRGGFISPMDLCTIFGNSLDNAIEACAKIKNENERMIFIRVQEYADQLIIKIRNSFEGELIRRRDELISTKLENAGMHGFGVSNIRKAVQRYGGIIRTDVPEKGIFELKILIPIPETT